MKASFKCNAFVNITESGQVVVILGGFDAQHALKREEQDGNARLTEFSTFDHIVADKSQVFVVVNHDGTLPYK